MITPSHVVYNLVLLRERGNIARAQAIVSGALIPDALTYFFFFFNTFIMGYSFDYIWGDLYFDSGWSVFINATHSLVFWPFTAAVAYAMWKQGWQFFFFVSASLHAFFDFFVHTDDAYAHFWPLSDWRFHSPISYWNPSEYGNIFGIVDTILAMIILVYLYRTTDHRFGKIALFATFLVYLAFLYANFFVFGPNPSV